MSLCSLSSQTHFSNNFWFVFQCYRWLALIFRGTRSSCWDTNELILSAFNFDHYSVNSGGGGSKKGWGGTLYQSSRWPLCGKVRPAVGDRCALQRGHPVCPSRLWSRLWPPQSPWPLQMRSRDAADKMHEEGEMERRDAEMEGRGDRIPPHLSPTPTMHIQRLTSERKPTQAAKTLSCSRMRCGHFLVFIPKLQPHISIYSGLQPPETMLQGEQQL